jgi:dihydroorotate dehydrogenase electron transfer subunit
MNLGKGQVAELILEDGRRYVRVSCPPNLIPSPGQYLLASDGSDLPLPVPLFYTDSAPQGFIAQAPEAVPWNPGIVLHLRGPLGRGFTLPFSARKVGLVAFDDPPIRLRCLIHPALRQDAAVALVCDTTPDDLPDAVEVQPLSTLNDILEWADYVAFDVSRGNLHQLKERLGKRNQLVVGMDAQVLVRTPVPCGGIAECGVCAVTVRSEGRLACKDGPVFDWRDI